MNMKAISTISLLLLLAHPGLADGEAATRPNILFCILDDASYPHMGAYGTDWVKTPGFDRLAAEGILFQNAYTPNAKCAPSRASVLTGRNSWELDQIGVHVAVWPKDRYPTYVEALEDNGYFVGWTGKGWGPGVIEDGADRALTGKEYNDIRLKPPVPAISNKDYASNFRAFLDDNPEGQPWCFWYGAHEPHRRYKYGTGVKLGGKKPADVDRVPAFWPDNETVRTDMLDYAYEIEYADQHLEKMLQLLEETGQLENTLIVFTADNGMPFPRSKGFQYEASSHMPLAIMWKAGIRNPGRTEAGFVSFVDFAPTFLKVAGVPLEDSGMAPSSGKDLVEIFEDGYRRQDRSTIILGQERHDYGRPRNQGYPIRSIIRDGFLYIHNFKPDLWPAGNPETGYLNTDGSPTKTFILNLRREGIDTRFWEMNFGKNPAEQLYHIAVDPDCLVNLAGETEYDALRQSLKEQLFRDLARQQDPRVVGPDGDVFDTYPFNKSTSEDFYERYMSGEIQEFQTDWVEPTDYEAAPLD
jgi:arylsulfatase A-like enzyme